MKSAYMQTVTIGTALLALASLGGQAQKASPDLTSLRIEDLMNVNVTSASKKKQKISKVAAAIFVISEEDLRRSAATNIPDLLRMVPGLEIAQINPSTWAITAPGFNGEYSTELLVLIDGRTVYTHLFSGVYWDRQDVPLESIARIEVIWGPGAAVWSQDLATGPETQGESPNQQAQLRSEVNFPWRLQWTTSACFVGRLPAPNIPSYTRMDTNLVWQASDKISLGLVGQNLLRNLHQEYAGPDLTILPSLVRRSAYARLTWRF